MIDGKGPGRIGLVVHPTRAVDGALATLERWATQHDVGLVQLAIDGGRRPEVAPLGKLEPDDLVVALGLSCRDDPRKGRVGIGPLLVG